MKNKLTTVGIVFGGISGEHEVSIKSAQTIVSALRDKHNAKKFEVVSFYIDRNGRWWSGNIAEKILTNNSIHEQDILKEDKAIKGLFQLPDETKTIQVWFPVLHGPNGEDGTIQGLFKLTRKPFIGSDLLGSALGMDKIAMKAAFYAAGLPQIDYCQILSSDLFCSNKINSLIQAIESKLGYPCFVKPANLGSSVGINKAYNKKELFKGLEIASKLDNRMVVEKHVAARELECAVLGKEKIATSCVGEVRYTSDWYDYDAKYSEGSSQIIIPAPISEKISNEVRELSLLACQAIGVEGMARVDFFYEEEKNNLWVNEINTLPGFTSKSMYPMLWEASGINLSELVSRLIESAKE